MPHLRLICRSCNDRTIRLDVDLSVERVSVPPCECGSRDVGLALNASSRSSVPWNGELLPRYLCDACGLLHGQPRTWRMTSPESKSCGAVVCDLEAARRRNIPLHQVTIPMAESFDASAAPYARYVTYESSGQSLSASASDRDVLINGGADPEVVGFTMSQVEFDVSADPPETPCSGCGRLPSTARASGRICPQCDRLAVRADQLRIDVANSMSESINGVIGSLDRLVAGFGSTAASFGRFGDALRAVTREPPRAAVPTPDAKRGKRRISLGGITET